MSAGNWDTRVQWAKKVGRSKMTPKVFTGQQQIQDFLD